MSKNAGVGTVKIFFVGVNLFLRRMTLLPSNGVVDMLRGMLTVVLAIFQTLP